MSNHGWPGGSHGFAMWFSGAPEAAKLEMTEFWHPSVREVCVKSMQSVVASASSGHLRWNRKDKATVGLAHFMVSALAFSLRTNGESVFGYSGPTIKTLYNAFKPNGNRSEAMKNIFSVAGAPSRHVTVGEQMERAVIAVEGAENAPVVRMAEAFHDPSEEPQVVPIFVFWEEEAPAHPDWELTPVNNAETLDELALRIADWYTGRRRQHATQRSTPKRVKPSVPKPDADLLAKRRFILYFFGLLYGASARRVPTNLIKELLPAEVVLKLPETASAEDIAELCERLQAVDRTYRNLITSLDARWGNFNTLLKSGIRKHLARSVLRDDLKLLPELTEDEMKSAEIAWDVADLEYRREKTDVLVRCRELGFDATSQRVDLKRLDSVFAALIDLLKKKVEIDLKAVRDVGASNSECNRGRIRTRTGSAYYELRECLLRSLDRRYGEFIRDTVAKVEESPIASSAPAVLAEIERYLRPFARAWDDLESSI